MDRPDDLILQQRYLRGAGHAAAIGLQPGAGFLPTDIESAAQAIDDGLAQNVGRPRMDARETIDVGVEQGDVDDGSWAGGARAGAARGDGFWKGKAHVPLLALFGPGTMAGSRRFIDGRGRCVF